MSTGFAELVVDELLKFVTVKSIEDEGGELEYDRDAMVARMATLFGQYRRQRAAGSNSYNFFVRDTSARFATPVCGQGADSWGKPKLEPVYPDKADALMHAVELADKLAEAGFFE